MLIYLIRRILYAIPIALAVGLVCFMLVQIAPGDPINAIVPADAPQEVVEQVRRDYGLDKPLPVQFAIWISRVVQGDLGRSLATGRPVTADLISAIRNTLMLALVAAGIGFVMGSILGIIAAVFRGGLLDKAAVGFAAAGVSIPHYWLGMVLVVFFSVMLNWLPAMGAGPGGSGSWVWDWEHVKFLILPAVTLSVIPMGIITRTVRGVVMELLNQDFVTTLRGKGLRRGGIALHVLKNAAPSVLAVMGLQLGYLMGGSILVETVFSWPGLGGLFYQALSVPDLPLVQALFFIFAAAVILMNTLADVIYPLLDPRVGR